MNAAAQSFDDDPLFRSLPPEVQEVIAAPSVIRTETLSALNRLVAQRRDEAVKARKESGIEQTWMQCEEAYLGIDDENRSEFANAKWAKPMTMDGPLRAVNDSNSSDNIRATAYPRLTSRYVDAGAAKLCEVSLPVDGKPFTLKPTPVPELIGKAEDQTPAEQITGQPMPDHDGTPVTVGTLAGHQIRKAEEAAEKAADRIYDWLVECKHNAQMRKVAFDMARLGSGVLEGPVGMERRAIAMRRDPIQGPPQQVSGPTPVAAAAAISVDVITEFKPATKWVDVWCFYPAPGCGENIHNGDHCLKVEQMLAGELIALGKLEGEHYMPEAIDKVVAEGPGKANLDGGAAHRTPHRKQFQVWHYYGAVPREMFQAANEEQFDNELEDAEKAKDVVHAIVTMVNDTVIRAVLSPLHSGRLPFHVGNWRRRAGHWAGVGVGEQVRMPQRLCTAATRALINNAAKSAGGIAVGKRGVLTPADGNTRMHADKFYWLEESSGVDDVRMAFNFFEWPNATDHLMKIIEYAFRLAEEHSSIPLITQGQSGDTTPDTFSGAQLQDNNANQLLRDVGFGLNDDVTTPMVDLMYEWLLLDPDVPADEKGDWNVDTSGALAIIEKALQDIFVMQLLQVSVNPAYELSPARCMEQAIRTKRMNPALFQLTDEEKKARAKQPPPKDPTVQAAEIRAQATLEAAKSRDELAKERNAADIDRDTRYNEVMASREAAAANLRIEELKLKRELAILEYATQERLSLQDAKVKLADTTIKVQAQMKLAGADGKGPQVATPPDEPPGRAPNGTAYQA